MASEIALEILKMPAHYQGNYEKSENDACFRLNSKEIYSLGLEELKINNFFQSNQLLPESTLKKFSNAAVVTDHAYSSYVGKEILNANGSAIDAAIAAAITNGVIHSHHHGLGGGNFMLIHLKEQNKVISIDAREAAPICCTKDMFVNSPELAHKGGLATAIPGEIAGYWTAHKIGGKLPWKKLFEPAINMCKNGIKVSRILANAIMENENDIRNNASLSKIYINPITNKVCKENDIIKLTNLASTLEKISETSSESFYNGELSNLIVKENNENGGVWTLDDLKNYKAIERPAIEVRLNEKFRIYTSPPPSCGILVAFILSVMKNFELNKNTLNSNQNAALFYHRLLETFKHAFAKRSYFGDINYIDINEFLKDLINPESIKKIVESIDDSQTYDYSYYRPACITKGNHGTTHISIMAQNGDAVSLTSSINNFFGAKYMGQHTGIIYNGHMDDFSTPGTANFFGILPSEANFIAPGKRPVSNMSPIIILDENNNARLVIGSSGGTRIITAVSLVALRNLFLDINIKDAIDLSRFHHQLFPSNAEIEDNYSQDVKELIKRKGHEIKTYDYDETFVNAIEIRPNNELWAVSDARIGGKAHGF